MRKITAFIPIDLIESGQRITGQGVSETIREALRQMRHHWACQELLRLGGTVDLEADGTNLAELREDKVYDWDGAQKA